MNRYNVLIGEGAAAFIEFRAGKLEAGSEELEVEFESWKGMLEDTSGCSGVRVVMGPLS